MSKKKTINREKMNIILMVIGAFIIIFGVMCFIIKALSVEYIDNLGILHENFFLLPIGFLFIFTGMTVIFMSLMIYISKRKHGKNYKKIKEVRELIGNSKYVAFSGVGKSGLFCRYGSQLLMEKGKMTYILNDLCIGNNKDMSNTLVVVISISGGTKPLIDMLKSYKKVHAKIIAITSSSRSTLAKLSDITLSFEKDDNIVKSYVPVLEVIEKII